MPDPFAPFPEDWNNCLVVVAHPDDVEYPGASPIACWTSRGKSVSYLLASRGEAGLDSMSPETCVKLRMSEQVAAAREVGVETVKFLEYPDGTIQYGLQLRKDIAREIRRARPDFVLIGNHRETTGNGMFNMADHRAVGQAALDAVRDAANRWVFRDLVESPWSGVKYIALIGSPNPTHAVATGEYFGHGLRSLLAHKTYLKTLGTTEQEAEVMLQRFHEEVAVRFGGRLGVGLEMM